MQRKINFDKDWFFSLNDIELAKELLFDHSCWQKVMLPHDWSVGREYEKHASTGSRGGFAATGIGWYRKMFVVTKQMLESRVFLEFDGVFMNSQVWVNGKSMGTRPYGYISFGYDVTSNLVEGVNLIAVRVDCLNQQQSRWYNGCGIYRHVWLNITEKIYVTYNGTYITTPIVSNEQAAADYEIKINNDTAAVQNVTVSSAVFDARGRECCSSKEEAVLSTGENVINQSFNITAPVLWSPENPHMYHVITELFCNGKMIDSYKTNFGVRKIEFIPNKGFYLNDVNYKFKGVCLHHDGGAVGAAVPKSVLHKRLGMLKDMGCNAIRTAHNPFSPEFYDLCDELGLFVMDEIFDGWDSPKAPYDYGLYFAEWHEKDTEDFIKRDRNHPSVVLWSIGNEVHKMKSEIARKLQNIFHEIDPTRPVTCGIQGASTGSDENRAILDVAGYNDGGGACFIYDRDHEKRPGQLLVATEAPHTLQTRGFYRTQTWWRDKNQPRIEIENLIEEEIFFDGNLKYHSSYDNSGVRVCARDSWQIAENRPYLLGEFRWSGIDYYGESFGWPARKSESGVIDTANLPKDHFYLYQSMWVDKKDKPMVHLLPHWTHPQLKENTIVPVWVYTNCDFAELFLNGKSLGAKERGGKKHLQWNVPYVPGEITAKAYVDGKIAAEKSYKTAKDPAKLFLECDTENITDTAQINCTVCDADGVMVPYAENTVHYRCNGSYEIIGTENGDPLDLTNLASHKRNAFYGISTAVIKAKDHSNSGEIIAASIIGDKIFEHKTTVYIDVQALLLGGLAKQHQFSVYYTTDLTAPDKSSKPYSMGTGIPIDQTANIIAVVYDNDEEIFRMESLFTKGKREKVIDLAHGNKALNLERPAGPFAQKMQGLWSDGNFNLNFKEEGELTRVIGSNSEQKIGYWWYDFPVDFFEAQEYAGTGEIWFVSGEKAVMHMPTQQGNEVTIDNSEGGFSTAYGKAKTIKLNKI